MIPFAAVWIARPPESEAQVLRQAHTERGSSTKHYEEVQDQDHDDDSVCSCSSCLLKQNVGNTPWWSSPTTGSSLANKTTTEEETSTSTQSHKRKLRSGDDDELEIDNSSNYCEQTDHLTDPIQILTRTSQNIKNKKLFNRRKSSINAACSSMSFDSALGGSDRAQRPPPTMAARKSSYASFSSDFNRLSALILDYNCLADQAYACSEVLKTTQHPTRKLTDRYNHLVTALAEVEKHIADLQNEIATLHIASDIKLSVVSILSTLHSRSSD